MSRTTYTSTASYPLPVGWKCTKCGRINAATCNIKWSASASKQGVIYSQKTQNRASSQAKGMVMVYAAKIISDADKGHYAPCFQACVCKGCSHREPWASVKANGRFVSLCFMASFWLGILAIICIVIADWTSLCRLAGIIILLVASACLSMKLSENRTKKMEPIFAGLKDIEKPVMAPSVDNLRVKMCGILAEKPEDVDVIDKVLADELSE